MLDVAVEGEDNDPDAWCLARERLATKLLEALPRKSHGRQCPYKVKQ
jgi:hypothetical protein